MPNLVRPSVVVDYVQAPPNVWVDEAGDGSLVLALAGALGRQLLNEGAQAVTGRATHVVCAVQSNCESVVICPTYLGERSHHVLLNLSQSCTTL